MHRPSPSICAKWDGPSAAATQQDFEDEHYQSALRDLAAGPAQWAKADAPLRTITVGRHPLTTLIWKGTVREAIVGVV